MILSGRIPKHVGIIMDGNGRWAESRGLPRVEGHRQGALRSKEIIEAANDLGIKVLTLYAFSLENWQRPTLEVKTLMRLLGLYLEKELADMIAKGTVFKMIGDIWKLPKDIQILIRGVMEKTASSKGLNLVLALSYSGRDEILRAVKKVLYSGVKPEELTEEIFNSCLDSAGLPSPDLIIRTSGEMRVSNFLLWQGAYSELYFTDVLWPDFTKEEFFLAIQHFQQRERRFGAISTRGDAP
jgi:undecaprenyl diphosphate synthase